MQAPFDELGKQIGQAVLGPLGSAAVESAISPETQYADLRHEPDPAAVAGRARLGLLGRLVAGPRLLELYSRAPGSGEFRACLSKHLAFWLQHTRAAGDRLPAGYVAPFQWIIAAGTPVSLLTAFAAVPAAGWPAGVYLLGGDVLRVGLVAANKLPRDRSTLLVRLMAAGPLLGEAITELSALPADAYERAVVDPILLKLQHALGLQSTRTQEEEEFLVTMYSTWEDAREIGRKEGREQGQRLGRVEGRADAVLTILRVRGIPISDAERERVLAERDPARLERWLERAISAASLAELLGDSR